MISFFINKRFHSRISFSLNLTFYTLKRKQLQVEKIKIITNLIQKTLKAIMIKIKTIKKTITEQVNKHKKEVIYKKNNMMFLLSRNIKTTRSVNKLKNKMLNSF